MNLLNSRIIRFLIGIWLPILLIWWWWTASAESVDPFFPPLSAIWEQFKFNWVWQYFPIHVVPSLRNLFFGYFIGIFAGIVLGALLGSVKTSVFLSSSFERGSFGFLSFHDFSKVLNS